MPRSTRQESAANGRNTGGVARVNNHVVAPASSSVVTRSQKNATGEQHPRSNLTCPTCDIMLQQGRPTGRNLRGREILICWEDNEWYTAIVISYLPSHDEYHLVYLVDDALETTKLIDGRWLLLPKARASYDDPQLLGAVIRFVHPGDNKPYTAMVYGCSNQGDHLRVAYLNYRKTDVFMRLKFDVTEESLSYVRRYD